MFGSSCTECSETLFHLHDLVLNIQILTNFSSGPMQARWCVGLHRAFDGACVNCFIAVDSLYLWPTASFICSSVLGTQWLLQVTTIDNKVYLIEAPDASCRESWKDDIHNCIRKLDAPKVVCFLSSPQECVFVFVYV